MWEAPVVGTELYDMVADPYQLGNRLHELDALPDEERTAILLEQAQLRQIMVGLATCQGDSCRALEGP